ncbi:MAG TPA: AGE family epimerase/isomerase [Verrucomicrobiae bacterium]
MKLLTVKFSAVAVCAAMVFGAVDLSAADAAATPPTKAEYLRIADEVDANLQTQILDKFFPVAADEEHGGFYENFALDWTRMPGDSRSIVYQSRLTWTSAEAALRFPAKAEMYLAMTRRGAAFLSDHMWDKNGGGFFWTMTPGKDNHAELKQMYGHAFGIYALAASYKATKDPATLEMAKKAFQWMEDHAHDNVHLGYFENVGPDGKPASLGQGNAVGAQSGQKSMNTGIHLLEALTGLYQVWPDPLVKQRVQEMLEICRTRFYSDPGYLVQFLSTDWQRTLSPDSFGHDVEAGFLMVEAGEALGQGDDARNWTATRHLMDHALEIGWDNERGGLYDSGVINAEGALTGGLRAEKIWWVQAEQINALLLQHERFGKETSRYWDAFVKQWNWIRNYQVDHVHGGWWPTVRADGTPVSRVKADMWTECYHQARAMLVVSESLRKLANN